MDPLEVSVPRDILTSNLTPRKIKNKQERYEMDRIMRVWNAGLHISNA